MTKTDEDNAVKGDSNEGLEPGCDGSKTSETVSSEYGEPLDDGHGSSNKEDNQSKVLGFFARLQPTGSPAIPTNKPFVHGYHNFFLGEIADAGDIGMTFMIFNFIFPRYLDDLLARQRSKELGLPMSLRFRALNGMIKGSYLATSWLVLATSCSVAGIDLRASTEPFLQGNFLTSSRRTRTQNKLDGRDEKVAENYAKIGFLAGFPVAYAAFRDGWNVAAMHRIVPHLLPLSRLPLFAGFACISAEMFNVWDYSKFLYEQGPVTQPSRKDA